MDIETTDIEGLLIVRPKKFGDERGFFSEVFKQEALRAAGSDIVWTQDNHAFSAARGVLRGLHFQAPPFAQAKLIRVVRGAIYDVAVDIRTGSPTYGRHVGLELSTDNWLQLMVPAGFAHGYCTLTENTEVIYKVSAPYAPQCEGGLSWSDPALELRWPIATRDVQANDRDMNWPHLRDLQSPFVYEGRS